MNTEEFKKEIKKYTKEEIIEALCKSLFLKKYYVDILLNSKDIKFNKLMKKSEELSKELNKISNTKANNGMEVLQKRIKFGEIIKKSDKIQNEIDKLLDIKY